VVKKAQEMIDQAKESIVIAVWPKDLKAIQTALKRAQEREVKITIVSYGVIKSKLGEVYQHRASDFPSRERGERRFVLTVDNERSLIANFGPQKSMGGLFTKNPGIVQLFRDFVIHEIYIILLERQFPDQIRDLVGINWEKARVF
jgi:sugar-specific transcriptional regulator TrmB